MKYSPVLASLFTTALALVVASTPSEAASIVNLQVTRVDSGPTTVNLSTAGDLDWAYWAAQATGQTGAPSNDKLNGAIIGNLSLVGGVGATIRGSNTKTTLRYAFNNGSSPVSSTGLDASGLVFNSDIGPDPTEVGLSLSLAASSTQMRYASLYLGGFSTTGRLTLSLAGATTVVDATQSFPIGDPKQMAIYTFGYIADSDTDVLTATFVTVNPNNNSSHVGFQAASISAVPEPGTAALAGMAVALVGLRRRR